jgi:hypothetical protein
METVDEMEVALIRARELLKKRCCSFRLREENEPH